MYFPSLRLQPISTSHYYVSGDVTVHQSAAIAPGVLLQADPNGRIIIGAGVCIGIGSILHAHQGSLEIANGVIIGAEVLLVGQVKIGVNACIGSATTVINQAVEPGQIVPPGSLIGDNSQPLQELQVTDTVVNGDTPESSLGVTANPADVEAAIEQPEAETAQNSGVQVFGQVYVNQLLVKMFPTAQHFHQPRDQNGQS